MSEWTEERVEAIKAMWAEGLSAAQCAARLGGVTRKAVIGKLSRLGVSARAAKPKKVRPAPRPRFRSHPSIARTLRLPVLRVPKPLPTGPVLAPTCAPVTLLDRRDDQCPWIDGNTAGAATLMCGAAKDAEDRWCPYHRVLGGDRKPKRSEKDIARFAERVAA